MPRTPASRKRTGQANDQPTSRLMRVPVETYDLIHEWAERERRAMNQQLATIVEQWDRQQRQREAKEKRAV